MLELKLPGRRYLRINRLYPNATDPVVINPTSIEALHGSVGFYVGARALKRSSWITKGGNPAPLYPARVLELSIPLIANCVIPVDPTAGCTEIQHSLAIEIVSIEQF